MTDDPFTLPSQVGGGSFWKPADYVGQVHVFIGGTAGEGPNSFGNDYALCDYIWIPESTDVYQGDYAEVSQSILRTRVVKADVLVGVVEKVTTDKGREAWGLVDPDEKTLDSTRTAFLKQFAQKDGKWTMTTDPSEAPF